jgi:hypothetical protein
METVAELGLEAFLTQLHVDSEYITWHKNSREVVEKGWYV